jgi:hypothetical protein
MYMLFVAPLACTVFQVSAIFSNVLAHINDCWSRNAASTIFKYVLHSSVPLPVMNGILDSCRGAKYCKDRDNWLPGEYGWRPMTLLSNETAMACPL